MSRMRRLMRVAVTKVHRWAKALGALGGLLRESTVRVITYLPKASTHIHARVASLIPSVSLFTGQAPWFCIGLYLVVRPDVVITAPFRHCPLPTPQVSAVFNPVETCLSRLACPCDRPLGAHAHSPADGTVELNRDAFDWDFKAGPDRSRCF